MGWFSDACSAVGRFVGGVCDAVRSAFSAAAKVLTPIVQKTVECIAPILQNSELMQKLIPILAVVIPPPYDVVAVAVVEVLCALCGKEEKPEELGYQMNEADKAPEDFESFEMYREYLDEKFPFDREKFDALSDEQKSACRLAGIAGALQDIKESTGKDIDPNVIGALSHLAKDKLLEGDALKGFIENMCDKLAGEGLDPIQTIADYTKQEIAPDDFDKLMASCEDALAKSEGEKPSAAEVMSTLANPSCAESL